VIRGKCIWSLSQASGAVDSQRSLCQQQRERSGEGAALEEGLEQTNPSRWYVLTRESEHTIEEGGWEDEGVEERREYLSASCPMPVSPESETECHRQICPHQPPLQGTAGLDIVLVSHLKVASP